MATQASHARTPDSDRADPAGLEHALYVVATPLGNLSDLSARAIDTLARADCIGAEDTRTSSVLLAAHGIRASLFAAHDHNESSAAARVLELLAAGKTVALISDAGTPAVSDPGARIVRAVLDAGLRVIPVPGPSAVVCALSASGLEGAFHFHGFLPPKSGARRARLRELRFARDTQVFYEAPHRIVELADDLAAEIEATRRVVIARELTKRFETVHATRIADLPGWLAGDGNRQRGEFVVMLEGANAPENHDADHDRVLSLLLGELPLRSAAHLAAAITGAPRNAMYQRALALRNPP
jgi:16S rRNA (cytidine1402-2'-O)-methyltransferase